MFWIEMAKLASTFKGEAAVAVLGALMGIGFFVASEDRSTHAHDIKAHAVEYMELRTGVEVMGKDVAYSRERGDIIQSQNSAAHDRQEKMLDSINAKVDRLISALNAAD